MSSPRPPRSRLSIRLHVVVQVFLATWILWVGNAWAFRHSWRVDLTRDQRYAIPEETISFLRELPKRVDVIVPYSFGRSARGRIEQRVLLRAIRTVEEFEQVNPYCRVIASLDIGREDERWQVLREELELDAINRVYLLAGDRREVVRLEDLAEIGEGDEGPELIRERVPEALSAALERVVRDDAPRVVFTSGHGEAAIDDVRPDFGITGLVRDLRERGFEVSAVDLRGGETVPAGTDLLVIIGGHSLAEVPFEPFGPDDRAEVERLLASEGGVLALLPFDGLHGLEDLLASRGIEALPGLVNSAGRNAAEGFGALRASIFDEVHPVTSRFRTGADIVELNSFRALALSGEAVPLILSDPETWRESTLDGIRGADEAGGPFPLVAAASGPGRVVVSGSWTPAIDVFHRGQSRRLLLSAIDWLVDRERPGVGSGRIDAKDRVTLTPGVARQFAWGGTIFLPGSAVLAGLVVWGLRRRTA